MRPENVLSDQAVKQLFSEYYMNKEEAVIFVIEPSSEPITPVDMMFTPFINAEFSKDSTLGMIYGNGRGCAFVRKTAIEKIRSRINQTNEPINTCNDLVTALRKIGYKVQHSPLLTLDRNPPSFRRPTETDYLMEELKKHAPPPLQAWEIIVLIISIIALIIIVLSSRS